MEGVETVIELGAGKSGLSSVVCALLFNVSNIIITDGNAEALHSLNSNLLLNESLFAKNGFTLNLTDSQCDLDQL